MSEERRLAAIMFTDIVGYTKLMGFDEDKALETLNRNHAIQEKLVNQFNGTLIKEIGDGTLSSFSLASDAVRCAVEIQKACIDQEIPLKIGIHEGETIFSGSDVIGDGVNIASRIQENTQEGCINISASIYRDIKNKTDIKTILIGEKSFKNVDEPIKVYNVSFDGGPDLKDFLIKVENKAKREKSPIRLTNIKIGGIVVAIAALVIFIIFNSSKPVPFSEEDWIIITDFENLTGDSIFDKSLNVALEISIQQSVFVNVFPRTKVVETLKRMGKDETTTVNEETAIEIAQREGIKVIVVCSISLIGNIYSLSSRIVEVNTKETLRSAKYKAQGKDEVLKSLDKLGRKTRKVLGESLNSINYELVALPKATTASLEALKYFVEGNDAWSNGGRHIEARDLFLEAIKLDPEFALVHAYLGSLYYWLNDRTNGEECFRKALNLLDRLTEKEKLLIVARVERFRGNLDGAVTKYGAYLRKYPNSSAEWFSLGYCHMILKHYEKAIEAFNKSLEITKGNESNAYINIASCYRSLKYYQESIDYYLKAFDLNPNLLTVANLNHEFGFTYVEKGEFQKATEVFEKLKEGNDEQRAQANRSLALLNMYTGDMNEAIRLLKESAIIFNTLGYYLSELRTRLYLASAYKTKGWIKDFNKELNMADKIVEENTLSPWWLLLYGKFYAREGRIQNAELCLHKISENINEGNRSDKSSFNLLKGEIELAKGNFTEAKVLFETGLKLRKDGYTLESIAYYYYKSGDLDMAISKYKEMIVVPTPLGWEAQIYWIQSHYKLAKIYEEKGNREEAIEYYKEFLNIWKNADADLPTVISAKRSLNKLVI